MKYVMIFALILIVLILLIVLLIIQNNRLKKQNKTLEIENILSQSDNNKALRTLRHDVINQNFTVDMLLQKGDIAGAREFLSSRESRLENIIVKNFCANYIINGILVYESKKCEKFDVKLNCNASVSNDKLKATNDELCFIFNSLFDKAIKNTSDGKIDLDCKKINNTLCIRFVFKTSAKNFKLSNIKKIIEKYGGKADVNLSENKAEIKIFI